MSSVFKQYHQTEDIGDKFSLVLNILFLQSMLFHQMLLSNYSLGKG
jgi:hypothetical protein